MPKVKVAKKFTVQKVSVEKTTLTFKDIKKLFLDKKEFTVIYVSKGIIIYSHGLGKLLFFNMEGECLTQFIASWVVTDHINKTFTATIDRTHGDNFIIQPEQYENLFSIGFLKCLASQSSTTIVNIDGKKRFGFKTSKNQVSFFSDEGKYSWTINIEQLPNLERDGVYGTIPRERIEHGMSVEEITALIKLKTL